MLLKERFVFLQILGLSQFFNPVYCEKGVYDGVMMMVIVEVLFGWLVGYLTSSSTTWLYRGQAPRQSV